MNKSLNLRNKSFAIYGLGNTGNSVIKYLNKLKVKNYAIWDDNKLIKKKNKLNLNKKKLFINQLNFADYIILSPGININKSEHKEILVKNQHKIITDLDLFYVSNQQVKSIVVTGTNGKSTTCKILEHLLKKNKFKVVLGGNIGRPVLDLNLKNKPLVIIEASSFQLALSKFIKPNYALILNISNDHLDWHGSMENYINSKFKIFLLQKNNHYAFLNDIKLLKKYKREKYLAKIKFVKISDYNKIKNKIENNYLTSNANDQNMCFVLALSRLLNIKDKQYIKSLKSFKGLPHRYEVFLNKKNKIFINDSKATTFDASRYALKSNKNIYWIVGGKPKLNDKLNLSKIKNNIVRAYVIGKKSSFFISQLKGVIDYKFAGTIKKALKIIFKDIKKIKKEKIIILLSPASASYDQFKNFEERGNKFIDLVKLYAKKYN